MQRGRCPLCIFSGDNHKSFVAFAQIRLQASFLLETDFDRTSFLTGKVLSHNRKVLKTPMALRFFSRFVSLPKSQSLNSSSTAFKSLLGVTMLSTIPVAIMFLYNENHKMMRHVLVPVDFSANSVKAAAYGCMLAQRTSATVTLFHAIEPVADKLRQPFPLHEKYLQQAMDDRLNELASLKHDLEKMYHEVTITYFAQHGTAAATISEFIRITTPKLVVMGTRGKNAFERIFIGSVAKDVIGRSVSPVIVVPDKYVQADLDAIVIATNHFETDIEYLTPIVELAAIFKATVHVIVFIDTNIAQGADFSELSFRLDSYSQFLKKQFPGVVVKTELLEGSEFEQTVEKYDEAINADIFALFTYPKNTWEKIANNSMAKKMVSISKIPMLVVPVRENPEFIS